MHIINYTNSSKIDERFGCDFIAIIDCKVLHKVYTCQEDFIICNYMSVFDNIFEFAYK